MDRQKKIPELSKKITRKLAHESADHNELMNFYSSISRDETGAPKRWKMSKPECIDESSMINNKKGKKKPGDDSTQEAARGRRSFSAETKKRKMSDVGAETSTKVTQNGDIPKKKRGRPRSLDLSAKVMKNGDDDGFKSPDPLTPINVAVKRRKGRPKETPPTLVAESPPVPINHLDETAAESSLTDGPGVNDQEPVKKERKKPGRKPKLKPGVIVKKKTIFGVKRGLVLKPLGAKKKLGAGSKVGDVNTDKEAQNEQSRVASVSEIKTSTDNTDSTVVNVEKRKPGRPPGAKNKTGLFFSGNKKPKRVGNSTLLLKKAIMINKPIKKKGKVGVKLSSKNTVIAETSVKSDNEINMSVDEDNTDNVKSCPNSESPNISSSQHAQTSVEVQTEDVSTAINEVKAKDALRTLNTKQRVGAKSLGKIKKSKDLQKLKNKRILTSQAVNSDALKSLAHLAKNDLRRKLHIKLIEKLSGKRLAISNSDTDSIVPEVTPESTSSDQSSKLTNLKPKTSSDEPGSYLGDLGADIQNLSAQVEQKRINKVELDSNGEVKKKRGPGRPRKSSLDQKDITKFSDTESVCSEISSASLGSQKRILEKQILILGEDNTDSDNDTVRTRQRFEIIPGKKRKRTLSGEFDLVDERKIRKELKTAVVGGVGASEEKHGKVHEGTKQVNIKPKRRSPVKVSPETIKKIKLNRLEKKAASPYRSAHRAKLLKESPFLTRLKRKRRTLWKKKPVFSDSTVAQKVCKNAELDKGEVTVEKECLDGLRETVSDIKLDSQELSRFNIKLEPALDDKAVVEICVPDVKVFLGEKIRNIEKYENLTDEEYIKLLLEELVDQVVGDTDKVNTGKMHEGRESVGRESIGTSSDSVASGSVGRRRKKRRGWHLMKNKPPVDETVVEVKPARVKQNARKSFRQEKESPESTTVRKFELRQKISRSPLDNIALKQSIEESEYYKTEAQKAIKKEAKQLKLRRMFYPQDATDDVALEDSVDGDLSDFEYPAQPLTIEDMMKECKPCSVVLRDFIKQLQRAQGGSLSTDDLDSDGFESSETETDVFEDGEAVKEEQNIEDFAGEAAEVVQKDEETENNVTVNNELPQEVVNDTDPNVKNEEEPVSPVETLDAATEESATKVESPAGDQHKPIQGPKPVKIGPGKKRGPKPTKNVIKPASKGKGLNILPLKETKTYISEQQTARKTVPPLKLKLKVGTSKRKTYMVEPCSELGKLQINEKKRVRAKPGPKPGPKLVPKPGPKLVPKSGPKLVPKPGAKPVSKPGAKPGPKPGPKPGQKAESDSEKNKNLKNRKKLSGPVNSGEKEKKLVKKTIVPSGAYETNFFQFIQEKTKPITGLLAASKARQNRKMIEKQIGKAGAEESLTVTAKSSSETTVSTHTSVLTTSKTDLGHPHTNASQTDQQGLNESEAVNYICSQCDKVSCKSEEEIINHFKAVHPNDKMMYKPLTELTSEDGISDKERLSQGNIFDRMNTLLPEGGEKREEERHNELGKTSAEADSTTDFNHGATYSNQEYDNAEDAEEDPFAGNDGNESDSGSLNLKIVDVVSLKDQSMDLQDISQDATVLHQPQLCQNASLTSAQANPAYNPSELKVPQYPRSIEAPAYNNQQVQISPHQTQAQTKKKAMKGGVGNTFKCEKCNVHAPMLAAMVAHLRNTHKDIQRLFQCPYCSHMEAESEAKIHSHIRQFHPTNNPNPPVALSEPAKRNLKTLSVKLPDIVKPGDASAIEKDIYMCLKCRVHMSTLEMINEHLDAEHKEVFVFMCPVCKQFKSSVENIVMQHLRTSHPLLADNVSISLAIDGRQFTRVPCLIKDKMKSSPKSQQVSPASRSLAPPVNPFSVQNSSSAAYITNPVPSLPFSSGYINHGLLAISDQYTKSIMSTTTGPTSLSIPFTSVSNAQSTLKSSVSTTSTTSSKTASAPKKKKNLLESIEQLKTQKQLEQQGLLNSSKSGSAPVSESLSVTANQKSSANPPPLMRGPPPLIRYDQLGKVPNSLISNSELAAQSFHGSNQRLNALPGLGKTSHQSSPRPIQSSLFDTSDPDAFKPINREKTVLNIPSIPHRQPSMISSKGQTVSSPLTTKNKDPAVGAPLDLSKSTPSSSPVPRKQLSPKQSTAAPEGINPEMFKVFNLQPSTMAAIRTSMASPPGSIGQPQIPAQVIIPQQVRPNTTNTLAYRPSVPHVASSQMPQIISMPMGAVIGNVLVSISSMPQTLQQLPTGIQGAPSMQTLPQFIRMSTPVPVVSHVATPSTIPRTLIQGNQLMNFNLPNFKCPYCPKVIPLKLAEVQPHIEKFHPGSSIVFMQLDSAK